MNKFVSCICICLALVVAVMPLCAFKCADVSNAPAMVENRPVMASNRPLVEPVVAPPLSDFVLPSDYIGTRFVINLDLPDSELLPAEYIIGYLQIKNTGNPIALTNAITGDSVPYGQLVSFGIMNTSGDILLSAGGTLYDSGVYYLDFLERPDYINYYYKPVAASSNTIIQLFNEPDYVIPFNSSFFYVYVEPEPQPTVVEQLIDILVAGIGTFGANIGQGLTDIVVNVFVDTSQETFALTTFGGVVAVFAGLALAVGLSKLVTSFIMRLGCKE